MALGDCKISPKLILSDDKAKMVVAPQSMRFELIRVQDKSRVKKLIFSGWLAIKMFKNKQYLDKYAIDWQHAWIVDINISETSMSLACFAHNCQMISPHLNTFLSIVVVMLFSLQNNGFLKMLTLFIQLSGFEKVVVFLNVVRKGLHKIHAWADA